MKIIRKYIGMRTIKTAIAVALCFVVYELRGRQGIPFYSALAAIWCIRPDIINTRSMALQRTIGTAIGAVYGLVVLLAETHLFTGLDEVAGYLLSSAMLIPIIVTTVILKKKDVSYFSCVVFLSITINHLTDENPFLFVWNRSFDTMIGIIIAMLVNCARFPYRKNLDTLYVSGLDEILLTNQGNIPDFSKRELNRMLDEGMHFTIATMRTPASLITPLKDLHIKLPIIAMDGAVLFSMKENAFLKTVPIPYAVVRQLTAFLDEVGVHYFINSILEDSFFIYYGEMKNDAEKSLYLKKKTSPYRNYLKGYPKEDEAVVYLTLLLKQETCESLIQQLQEQEFFRHIRLVSYPSTAYPEYFYLKIYSIVSSRKAMIDYLKKQVNVKNSLTFGTIKGQNDIYTKGYSADEVVRNLRKHYEPIFWSRNRQ